MHFACASHLAISRSMDIGVENVSSPAPRYLRALLHVLRAVTGLNALSTVIVASAFVPPACKRTA